jgi:hypothetical protein
MLAQYQQKLASLSAQDDGGMAPADRSADKSANASANNASANNATANNATANNGGRSGATGSNAAGANATGSNAVPSAASVAHSAEYQAVSLQLQTLEQRLELTPMSGKAIALINSGNPAGATAVIEGQGDPVAVLNNYLWSMLDVAHLDEPKGLLETGAHRDAFTALASSAMDYINNRLPERLAETDSADWKTAVKVREAEVLYNIAANTVPYTGKAPADATALALQASRKELAIRMELKQTLELGRTNWVLGALNLNAGDPGAAQRHLSAALDLATQSNDQPTVAWTKVYLSKALAGADPAKAQQLKSEGLALAEDLRGKGYDDMVYLLGDASNAQK